VTSMYKIISKVLSNWSKRVIPNIIDIIPKTDNPIGLDEYTLISLVASMYKIISKVLSNWSKGILPNIIDITQSAFIISRGLLDSVLLVNEVIEEVRCTIEKFVIVKVNFGKKMYNLVNPKTDNPISLDEYRLISLVASMYKIISKVLSN